jgi:triosephosphate isomerase (TIM)
MAKLILVANWKNYPSSMAEAADILKGFSKKADLYKKLSTFIAPPLPYLGPVGEKGKKFSQLGVQDLFPLAKGTHTGAVTPDILKSFGVRLAILGHSERRALGETSEQVAEKVRAALKVGIVPLVCVGENVRDTDGEHFEFLREQIKASLGDIPKQAVSKVVLAYEPSWAIGKSAEDALAPADLMQSVLFIRKILSDLYGRKVAEGVQILYGGSVDPTNAGALVKEGGVRGLLVGRASLDPKKFELIAQSLLQK